MLNTTSGAVASVALASNEPVSSLNLIRYAGQWHEIAHLPMYFQRKCKDRIIATYTLRPDGWVDVRNECRTFEGEHKVAHAVARPVKGRPGALKVRFAPRWLSWLPMVWADYWVIALDPDYHWALVGGPSQKYLWVLSRQPSMPKEQFDRLVTEAARRGYPVDRLVMAAPLI